MTNCPRPGRLHLWLTSAIAALVLAGGAIYWLNRSPREDRPVTPSDSIGDGHDWFIDKTATAELDFTYRNGEEADRFTILETLGGGVALLDYDGDGLLDIFVTGGGFFDGPEKKQLHGYPCKLYKNLGNWRFKDVTADVGFDKVKWWYTHGASVADYDCDGWPDLLVTGYGHLALFRNVADGEGRRRFVDVTDAVGLRDDSWSTSAGWADLDGDGFPDLYVCHYVDWSFDNDPLCKGYSLGVKRDTCSPERFKPLVHALFRNEKGKAFRDVSAEQGFKPEGCGLGVLLADLNGDGRPDIYVANDTNNNFLFFNREPKSASEPAFRLEERGVSAGVAGDENGKPEGSMGVDAGNYDGTSRPSLWVTNFQGEYHALYRNLGREAFLHQSRSAGTAALGQNGVGFGTAFLDLDNDGWEDLVVVHGHVWRYPASGTPKQRPALLHNGEQKARRFFTDISQQGGRYFQTPAVGRGLAVGDLDNDGWPDLVVSHTNSAVALLRNDAAATMKTPHHWIGVKLTGRNHRDVVGSTIVVELEEGGRTLTRFAKGGSSYLSSSDRRILFGLGTMDRIRRVMVHWSWGKEQHWDNLNPNAYWELHEGQAEATRLP